MLAPDFFFKKKKSFLGKQALRCIKDRLFTFECILGDPITRSKKTSTLSQEFFGDTACKVDDVFTCYWRWHGTWWMSVENRGPTGCSLEGDREWQNDRTSCIQRARRSSKKKVWRNKGATWGDSERWGFNRNSNLVVWWYFLRKKLVQCKNLVKFLRH